METLTDFLLARIAEDEAMARGALNDVEPYGVNPAQTDDGVWRNGDHEMDGPRIDGIGITIYDEGGHTTEQAAHIARHDPSRVLAECEAKRRIVTLMGYVRESWENKHSGAGRVMWPDVNRREKHHALTILENLALPYADHPDYVEEWKP